jgi:hypothetical protein
LGAELLSDEEKVTKKEGQNPADEAAIKGQRPTPGERGGVLQEVIKVLKEVGEHETHGNCDHPIDLESADEEARGFLFPVIDFEIDEAGHDSEGDHEGVHVDKTEGW